MSLVELINSFPETATREEVVNALEEYSSSKSHDEIRKELPTIGSEEGKKLSKKVKDFDLKYLVFRETTGIEAQEQFTMRGSDGIPGFSSLRRLAALLKGQVFQNQSQTGLYLEQLVKEMGMPLLTKEHQAYVDRFDLEYVRQTTREQLQAEIPIKMGTSINRKKGDSAFLYELSRKVSQDPELQFELFKKWSGASSLDEITSEENENFIGYQNLTGFASFLKGRPSIGTTERGKFFRSFYGDDPKVIGYRTDKEYNQLRSELKRLKEFRTTKKRDVQYRRNFFGFGKCFEYYVGILLALSNGSVEHQYKIEAGDSFRLIDFFMDKKGYVALEELDELVEVKSGVKLSPHDRRQLEDVLEAQDGVTYVLHDKSSPIASALKEVAKEKGKIIKIIGHYDLSTTSAIERSYINLLFSNKNDFLEYAQTSDIKQLERDLFSTYLWVRAKIRKEGKIENEDLGDILDATYEQDQSLKESALELFGVRWLSEDEYNQESLKVFSQQRGRHFDLELAKKKLISKIRKYESELAEIDNGYDDYKKRTGNFADLMYRIETNIPVGASKWDIPPAQLVRAGDKKFVVYRHQGEDLIYQLNGVKSHHLAVERWIAEGRVALRRNKYFEAQNPVPI